MPKTRKDLPKGTENSNRRQAGAKNDLHFRDGGPKCYQCIQQFLLKEENGYSVIFPDLDLAPAVIRWMKQWLCCDWSGGA